MGTLRELFKDNLIGLRGARTLKEVAAGAGIPYSTYQRFEAEEPKLPGEGHLAALAEYFGVPISRFFTDPDLKPSPLEALEIVREALVRAQSPPTPAQLDALDRELAAVNPAGAPQSRTRSDKGKP